MRNSKRKRVLVTGGAGFIGSHLCQRLLQEGHEVICVDNYFTGSKENILSLMESPYFEVIRHDITMPLYIEADYIFNMACPASPVHYQFNPVQTTKVSVHGSINMLGLAKRLRVPIFQASTSEVYGDPKVHPQPESYLGHVNPIGPRACYDEGKRCAETLFFDYKRQHSVPVKVARIFNTYGPHMHPADGRVISNFIMQALRNEAITIYGNGEQSRSFCYVEDMVDGIMLFKKADQKLTGPLNLGNPYEVKVRELADLIVDLTGSSSRLVKKPLPQDDPLQRCPDISLAREELGWEPVIKLKEGLGLTIKWFEELISKGMA